MTLKMFRSFSSLNVLSCEVEDNIDRYRGGDFDEKLADHKLLNVRDGFSFSFFNDLKKTNNSSDDYDNAILLWNHLTISPRLAREARLWCFLTHTHGLEYCRARYPLDKGHERDVKNVRAHFLVTNELRGIDRDNALSRLWVSALIASKIRDLSFEVALEVLLYQTDFREQLIGHPTIMRSFRTLNVVMCQAKQILIDDDNKNFFRRRDHKGQYKTWFHLLDLEGGRVLLDALSEKDLKKLVANLAQQAASGEVQKNF